MHPDYTPKDVKRFWSKVDKSGECWTWQASRNANGYGTFKLDRKAILAHRFAWLVANGTIPVGLLVCHSCDNPPCCNPAHLWVGTVADNARDMAAKGRSAAQRHHVSRGSKNGQAKLREADIAVIRLRYVRRQVTLQQLASEFGVSESLIHCIVTRKTWKHVA